MSAKTYIIFYQCIRFLPRLCAKLFISIKHTRRDNMEEEYRKRVMDMINQADETKIKIIYTIVRRIMKK